MRFDSESGKEAGKISKRGSAIGVELRGSLYELVDKILNELNYESLNASQKIKLLDLALKYSLTSFINRKINRTSSKSLENLK